MEFAMILCGALGFGLLVVDAYVVTHRKRNRKPRIFTEAEENDLLWTSPRDWVSHAIDKVMGKGDSGHPL